MRRVLPPLVVLCLGFAPAPVHRPDKIGPGDTALRGEWVLVSETHGGLEQAPRKQSLVFFRRHLRLTGDAGTDRWELELDPASSPKAFDMRHESGPTKYRLKCVYRVDGDDLITCYNINKHSIRPPDLSGKGGWSPCLQVFKRKKP